MTTIAFDGNTLAIDNGLFSGNVTFSGQKMFHLKRTSKFSEYFGHDIGESVVALSGDYGIAPVVVNAINHNNPALLPSKKGEANYDISGILIDLDSGIAYFVEPTLALNRITALPVANGGGKAFAYGAMIGGLSALNAIIAANLYTDFAGHGVACFDLPEKVVRKLMVNYKLEEVAIEVEGHMPDVVYGVGGVILDTILKSNTAITCFEI